MTASSQVKSIGSFGKYVLIEKLGEGHLGPVFKAIDQFSGRNLALRILSDGIRWDDALEARFFHTCQAIAGLQHPNVAAIYDTGKEGESHYIATEFLGNDDLGTLIAQKTVLTVEKRLSIMIQAAEGLSQAHSHGILHLGLKPGKIHVAPDGCAKIRDFGIDHLLRRSLVRPGIRWGDPLYMSPEDIQHTDCDERSDVFSAGIVFYELLTGLHPFHDRNSNKAVDRILLHTDLPTIDQFPDLPPGLWAILQRCLAKNPDDRYQEISSFSNDCRDLLRDMAEDSQLMLAELQAALPRLKKAAALPGAPGSLVRLSQDIRNLLGTDAMTDYATLDRMMSALAEHYPALQAVATEPALEPLHAPALSEAKTDDAATSVEEPVPVTRRAPGNRPPDPRMVTSSPRDAVEPDIRFPKQLPMVVPARPAYVHRAFPKPSFRMAAALLSVLLIVTAVYLIRSTTAAASLQAAWSGYQANPAVKQNTPGPLAVPQQSLVTAGASDTQGEPEDTNQVTVRILLQEAKGLAAQRRYYESRVLIQRILEINPESEAALGLLDEIDVQSGSKPGRTETSNVLQAEVERVSKLISSGKLQAARAELKKLQSAYPGAAELLALRRQWEARSSEAARALALKQDEEKAAAQQKKEEEWTRRMAALLAEGSYNEARSVLTLWLAEDPASAAARGLRDRVDVVQRSLQSCEAALAEGKYQEALHSLSLAEQLNPADPGLPGLRRRIVAGKEAARATLTVRRLGSKATVLLDGRPAGSDGEIRDVSVGIGSHTVGIESTGGYHASRNLEFLEGQQVAYVYDLAAQVLRPMTDADGELIALRGIKEEPHRVNVEHTHGMFRGTCRGVLSFNYYEVEFKSESGWHGFQVPFKHLILKPDGRALDLLTASNGKYFQTFKVQSVQEAEKFKQTWEHLESLGR